MGRYDLLVTLGRLGLYELRADSLHLTSASEAHSGDLTTLAAKRVFAIGDPLLLERRARALAEAISVPIETLDLALANWGSGSRATLGVRDERSDPHALERSREALELSAASDCRGHPPPTCRPIGDRRQQKCRPHGHLQSP